MIGVTLKVSPTPIATNDSASPQKAALSSSQRHAYLLSVANRQGEAVKNIFASSVDGPFAKNVCPSAYSETEDFLTAHRAMEFLL